MKLTLASEQGVEILKGTGPIDSRDLQVLKAGLSHLFKSGKNRIVLELPEASSLPTEILYELTKFDVLARELAGRIVLAGVSAGLKDQLARFATPPVIECFDRREDAIAYFRAAAPAVDEGKFKAEIRQKELSGLTELRTRVSELERENELLQDRLIRALEARRPKIGDPASAAKISALEEKIEELLKMQKPGP